MKKEELLKFYTKFRIYIFPFVVVLSCLILFVFVIYPQSQKLILNQKMNYDLASKHKFLEAKAATLENIDEADLAKKLTITLSSYPTERDFGNIVGILKNTANENGFSVSGLIVNPIPTDESVSVQKYSVRMEALGSRHLLSPLATAIESQPRIMKVGTMNVSKSVQGDSVSVLMDIEVLYGSPPQNFGGPDSPLPKLSTEDEEILTTLASFRGPTQPSAPPPPAGPKGKSNPFE